ncbi:MAG: InlB B-repeat-containing protein, partial [Lachnospiraceae bacterium]|nr:InlB B-repeat-containing protein [Lachnospiraceae bacterium]
MRNKGKNRGNNVRRLFLIIPAVIVAGAALMIACRSAGSGKEKNNMRERQIGLGGAYVEAGDELVLNVFSGNDIWDVVDTEANGEVYTKSMYSDPCFVMKKAFETSVFDETGSGYYYTSSLKNSLDLDMLNAGSDADRAVYAGLLLPTYRDVDTDEYAYSQNSSLTGDTIFIPSYAEYLKLNEEGLLSSSTPLWTRSSKEGTKTFSYLTDGTIADGDSEHNYRRAANADLGINKVLYSYKGTLPELINGKLSEIDKESGFSGLIKKIYKSKSSDTWNIRPLDDSIKLYWDDMNIDTSGDTCKVSVSGLYAENDDYYYLYESGQSDTGYSEDNETDTDYQADDDNNNPEDYEGHRTSDIAIIVTDKPYTDKGSEIVYYAKASDIIDGGELSFEIDKKTAVADYIYLVAENSLAAGEPVELELKREAAAGLSVTEKTILNSIYGASGDKYTINTVAGEGGSVSNSVTVTKGGNVTLTATPSSGYTFEGWYESDTATSSISTSRKLLLTNVSAAKKYYARFKREYINPKVK